MLINSEELVTDVELFEDNDDDETEAVAAESSNNEDLGATRKDTEKVLDMFDVVRQVVVVVDSDPCRRRGICPPQPRNFRVHAQPSPRTAGGL